MKYLTKLNIAIVVAVVLLVMYVFGSCGKTDYQKEMESWKQRAAVAVAFSDSVRTENIKFLAEQAKRDSITNAQGKEIARLKASQSVMRKKNDATLTVLEKTLPDTCKAALDLAKNYRHEADTLLVALDSAAARDSVSLEGIHVFIGLSAKLVAANDSLEKLIKTVPVYQEKKILGFLPLPNRKVSFIVGAILASVVSYEVAHH